MSPARGLRAWETCCCRKCEREVPMWSRLIFVAAMLAAGGAQAQELGPQALGPMQGKTVALGEVTGVAYYTVEPLGYRVVATLSSTAGVPIRFIATLQPEQSVIVSVPRGAGDPALEKLCSPATAIGERRAGIAAETLCRRCSFPPTDAAAGRKPAAPSAHSEGKGHGHAPAVLGSPHQRATVVVCLAGGTLRTCSCRSRPAISCPTCSGR